MVSEFSDRLDLENITVTLTFKKSGKLSGVFDAGTLSTTAKMAVNIGGITDVTTFEYTLDGDTLTTVSHDGTIEVYQRQ
jgi:hypothetical protein